MPLWRWPTDRFCRERDGLGFGRQRAAAAKIENAHDVVCAVRGKHDRAPAICRICNRCHAFEKRRRPALDRRCATRIVLVSTTVSEYPAARRPAPPAARRTPSHSARRCVTIAQRPSAESATPSGLVPTKMVCPTRRSNASVGENCVSRAARRGAGWALARRSGVHGYRNWAVRRTQQNGGQSRR